MKVSDEGAVHIRRIWSDQAATHIQRIKWALSFCHPDSDLTRLGAGDRERLRYKLYEFVEDSNLQGTDYDPIRIHNPTEPPGEFAALVTDQMLEDIQRELRTALDKLVGKEGEHVFSTLLKKDRFEELDISCIAWTDSHPFQASFQIKGGPQEKALVGLVLHAAFARLLGQRLKRCPICQTIFVRDERKPQKNREAYCGPTCRVTAATRKRAATKAAAAAKEAAAAKPKPTAKSKTRKSKR